MTKPADRRLGRTLWLVGTSLLVVSLVGLIILWRGTKHSLEAQAAERRDETDRGPVVLVASAEMGPPERDVLFTADVRGFFQTTLYAKVSGYVLDVRVDKGDRVKAGQVLGRIESPELDQALVSARSAELLRKQLADRARVLAPNIVAQQDLETANSNLVVSRATVGSAEAMKEYEVIRAPFDGVVTARYVDPGALLPAATGGTQSALPFVDLSVTDRVRVDIYVAQDIAPFVHVGDKATITEDQKPDVVVPATVTRFAGSLDPRTRTMLVEIDVDNQRYGLLPGTFATVSLRVAAPPFPTVPAEALVVRDGKNMVAKISGNHVHLVEVLPGRTDGKTLEIRTGVEPNDVVALNLPAEVADGAAVQPKEKRKAGDRKAGPAKPT